MSDYTYSEQAVEAWRKVLRAKLELFDAVTQLEEIIGIEFDANDGLDQYLAAHALIYCGPDDADNASSEDLEDFFGPCLPEDAEDCE